MRKIIGLLLIAALIIVIYIVVPILSEEDFFENFSDTQQIISSLIVLAVFYIYASWALFSLAKKLHIKGRWRAWIPIVNWYLVLKMAQKPWWWFPIILLPYLMIFGLTSAAPVKEPLVTILAVIAALLFILSYHVMTSMMWVSIVRQFGKPWWHGVAMVLVPFFGLPYLGYLAWGKSQKILLES